VIALLAVLPESAPERLPAAQLLQRLVAHMEQRDLVEVSHFGVTWPGTNALAWFELQQLRALTESEFVAWQRCIVLMSGYRDEIEAEDGFRLQKALYSYFFVGLALNHL
jgi:hypothetical protein